MEQMTSHGLEQCWALYDSHHIEDLIGNLPGDTGGDLLYFRGDVIKILERTDAEWGLGVCRGRLGVFVLAHTTPGPFVQALRSVVARNDTELSFVKGAVMPAAFSDDQVRYTVHQNAEYGLADCDAFTIVGPPSIQDRQNHPDRYYTYSPLREDEIRLAYITPENIAAFLACDKQSLFIDLYHVPLARAPVYEAFSYCWGGPNDKHAIFCNGKLLYIPSTLWRAIRWNFPEGGNNMYSIFEGSRPAGPRPAIFWADAICINQVDVLEKNHQIPLMRSIYSNAAEVLVYVNETNSGFLTMACLEMIKKAAEDQPQWSVLPHNINQQLDRVDWNAVHELFTQAVFRRSWVIQEIVLGNDITICYGMARLKIEHINAAITALHSNNARPSNSSLGQTVWTAEAQEALNGGVQQLFNLALVKARWLEGSPELFIEVLRRFRGAKATDQRDKVYALLSLAPKRYQDGLIPDYSATNTVADVYKRLARLAADSSDIGLLLSSAGGPHGTPGLPSWVPDWSHEMVHVIDFGLYHASGSRRWLPNVEQRADPNILTMRGAIVDKITEACPRWTPKGDQSFPDLAIRAVGSVEAVLLIVHHITRAAYGLEDRCGRYPIGGGFSTAIWQTLTCGLGWGARRRATSADRVHYDAFLARFKDVLEEIQSQGGRNVPIILGGSIVRNEEEFRQALEGIQAQDIQRYLRRPENDETSQEEQVLSRLGEQLYPFLNMVMHYQSGRRTCVTHNLYLGTVPAEAEEGDVIAIFFRDWGSFCPEAYWPE
jgi:hypothetical protein